MECWKEMGINEIAILYRMGLDGYHRCRRVYGDGHAMGTGMKKALRAVAATPSAQEKPITVIVSRTKGENQDEAAQIDI